MDKGRPSWWQPLLEVNPTFHIHHQRTPPCLEYEVFHISIHNPQVSPLHPWDNYTLRETSPLGCDTQRKKYSCVAFPSELWSRPPLTLDCKPSPPTSSSTPGSSPSSCPSNTFSQSCLPSSYYHVWPSCTAPAWGKILLYVKMYPTNLVWFPEQLGSCESDYTKPL